MISINKKSDVPDWQLNYNLYKGITTHLMCIQPVTEQLGEKLNHLPCSPFKLHSVLGLLLPEL